MYMNSDQTVKHGAKIDVLRCNCSLIVLCSCFRDGYAQNIAQIYVEQEVWRLLPEDLRG